MKGIILAGGSGTRLYPITMGVSKQLMPIYDKPMVYYPLSTLMEAGINEILIITTPHEQSQFKSLLGDGSKLGCRFEYAVQPEPKGLAQAFTIAEDFIGGDKVALILGDNIFYGSEMSQKLAGYTDPDGGIIFGYHVADPERYGVVEFDENMRVKSIEEKPENPASSYAVPGLYFYDNLCIEYAKNAQPSARGELEISEIQNAYLANGKLEVRLLDKGTAWLDTGTFESMMQAANFVYALEERTGEVIGSIELAAYKNGWITADQVRELAANQVKSGYGKRLLAAL